MTEPGVSFRYLPEPWAIEHENAWAIYDDNEGRLVAHFYFEKEALDYLSWRNSKIAAQGPPG